MNAKESSMVPLPNQMSDNSLNPGAINTEDEQIRPNKDLVVKEEYHTKRDDKSTEEDISIGDIIVSENKMPIDCENRRSSMSDFDDAKRCNNFDDSWGECIIGDLPSELMRRNSDSLLNGEENKAAMHSKKKGKLSFLHRGRKKKLTSFADDDDDCSISSEVSFSSVYSGCSTASDYQGPCPVGKDGKPLKSCMKKNPSDNELLGGDEDEDDDSCSVTSSTSKTKIKRNISFSSVEIRDYDRAIGDNPCVSSGVPLSLDWNYNAATEHDLEEYENFKESSGGGRTRAEMQMPSLMRSRVLKEFGANPAEIRKATKEASQVKKGRLKTMTGKTEFIDKTKSKLKQFCVGRNEDRQQEKLWENAHKEAIEKYLAGDTSVIAPTNEVSLEEITCTSLSIANDND
mmetsp:Transcript_1540/g.2103  ORF Transcript_1540/g.2103 Transcript_1540/m.2103 type:complete len:401 (-) Transcript_1540:36-1238(-)